MKEMESYKKICKIAGVPKLIIDNPNLINSSKLSKEDIVWAKNKIKEYEERRTFKRN